MSKVRLHTILVILILLGQASLLSAENTFVETIYGDPCWILATSDIILRANTCEPTDWYDNVFNPCGNWPTRYWKLATDLETGRAFPMSVLGK
jgi:hypothetical protein